MSLKKQVRGIMTLCATLVLFASSPVGAQTHPTAIALSPYLGVLWTFEADIGAKRSVFLFDTGGGVTVITPQTAAEIDCKPWGQLTGFRMRGDRIDMTRCNDVAVRSGNVRLTASTAGVFDFAKLLPKDAPPLAGSIALDSFGGKVVTIDLAHRRLVIETHSSLKERIARGREVELRLAGEASGHAVTPFVAVETSKGKVWMEIDTGSNSSVIVGAHNADLFGMAADNKGAQRFRGELAGGVPLAADDAHIIPLILDGNIGAAILEHWNMTIDVAHSRAWIAPATADRRSR